jgi:hypothetical protein
MMGEVDFECFGAWAVAWQNSSVAWSHRAYDVGGNAVTNIDPTHALLAK